MEEWWEVLLGSLIKWDGADTVLVQTRCMGEHGGHNGLLFTLFRAINGSLLVSDCSPIMALASVTMEGAQPWLTGSMLSAGYNSVLL